MLGGWFLTEVRWPRNVVVEGGSERRVDFEACCFSVCIEDDVLKTGSSLSSPSFTSYLVVFVISFVCTVDDLTSTGLGRTHDELSTTFGHHHSNLRPSKRWYTKIEFNWICYDELVVHLVGRRHPAPEATKAGPRGTSSRYFEGCKLDKGPRHLSCLS